MPVVVGPSNYVEPYGSGVVPKPVPLHVDANGGIILGAGAVAALLGSVRIQDGAGATLGSVTAPLGDASAFTNVLQVVSELMGWNGANFDRLRSGLADSSLFTGVLAVHSGLQDGAANWRRSSSASALVDAGSGTGSGSSSPILFNNVLWDRQRSASTANLGSVTGLGAALVASPGNWAITNSALVNVQATATRAGVAGKSHVITEIDASILTTAILAAAASANLLIRDGASGVGAILKSIALSIPNGAAAGSVDHLVIPGLNIVGTPGNAMTVELDGAAGANTFEKINGVGYDAS